MALRRFLILAGLTTMSMLAQANPPIYYCNLALESDPSLQQIRGKVVLSGLSEPSFTMMVNESYPTQSERQEILAWGSKREHCIKENPPQAGPITQVAGEGFNAVQALIVDLYKGAITYGQFAKQRQDVQSITNARMQQIIGQYQRQQSAQQQYQQQRGDYLDQACLNRARNPVERANCGMERAGRQIGEALSR
jgi:hypothetical protein